MTGFILPIGYLARQTTTGLALLASVLAQASAPRYTARGLACAEFHETVDSDIRSSSGSVSRSERAGREGVLMLRATEGDSALEITAWYDTLSVFREGPEGRIIPDTDGLLGGRWRGTLMPTGEYLPLAVPFIPDEVAQIAELHSVLDDFLPLLPDTPLRQGERYHWNRHRTQPPDTLTADTLSRAPAQEVEEEGTLTWDLQRGPVSWERTLRITARVPASRMIPRGMQSVVTQRIRVTRSEC